MRAIFGDEDENGIGLRVIDNNGVSHGIHVAFDGEITYHEQDGYPDEPAKRTSTELVHLHQARRFAKYHVQRERGYPTLSPRLTPEWLPYSLGAVFALEFDAFERQFGPYAQQYHSALRPDIDPILEMPEEDAPTGLIVYRADVFLGLDFDSYLEDPEATSPMDAVSGLSDTYELYETLSDAVFERLVEDANPIEEVSALDLQYQRRASDGSVEEPVIGERSHTAEKPADAQLQMTPPKTTINSDLTTELIQGLVCHHLQCQVRDAYLRLGLEPPTPFRVLGQGLAEQTMHYQHADIYPPYHLTDADIEGYRPPGIESEALADGRLVKRPELASLTTRLKRALLGSP